MDRRPPSLPADDLRQRTLAGLHRLGLALKQAAWERDGAAGLHPVQAQVLLLLRARGGGPLRLGAVAAEMGATPASVSASVGALAAKGLVRKEREPGDGRALALTLTPAGEAAAARAAEWPDALLEAVDALTAEEQGVLLRSLCRMIRVLQERGRIPVQRMCVQCRFFRPRVHPDPDRPHHCDFVDAAFGDRDLRLDCPDFDPVPDCQKTSQP